MDTTKLTRRDEELAALLGHKPTESTWKPTLFLIARFREETERLSKETPTKPVEPNETQGIAWALFVAAHCLVKAPSMASAIADADDLLSAYKRRFGNGKGAL